MGAGTGANGGGVDRESKERHGGLRGETRVKVGDWTKEGKLRILK